MQAAKRWPSLQEGGLWVNLGPLLYHWADAHSYLPGEELSIELSLDTVVRACHAGGFRTLQSSMVPSVFNGNLRCAHTLPVASAEGVQQLVAPLSMRCPACLLSVVYCWCRLSGTYQAEGAGLCGRLWCPELCCMVGCCTGPCCNLRTAASSGPWRR